MRLPLALVLAAGIAFAEDAAVTIQYDGNRDPENEHPNPAYRGTALLEANTVEQINATFPATASHTWNSVHGDLNHQSAQDLATNFKAIQARLMQLRDGDVLVLNVHSGAKGVGVPTESGEVAYIPWSDFWKHFGMGTVPSLSLAIVNGCMFGRDEKGAIRDATDEEITAVRQALHAVAMVGAHNKIDTNAAQKDLIEYLKSIPKEDSVLPSEGGRYRLSLSRDVKPERASMKELRFRAAQRNSLTAAEQLSDTADKVVAVEDEADAVIVPPQMQVVPWHSREEQREDGWTPFRFDFTPRGKVAKVVFRIKVKSIKNSIPETDTFHGDVGGEWMTFKKDFTDCTDGETEKTIEVTDEKTLAQVQTGKLRCCLQDDSYLYEADMTVYYSK